MSAPDTFRADVNELLNRQAAERLAEQRQQDERRARIEKMPRGLRYPAAIWYELTRPAPVAALIVWLTGVITGVALTLLFVHDKIH